jgi:hypothetical protein
MPSKKCPDCGKVYGVRQLTCECGHDFGCKRSGKVMKCCQAPHPLYPEPGAWVADTVKGMPDISSPEPLPQGPLDAATVKEVVSYEGLGYTVYTYIPPERIADSQLRKLWQEARTAMQRVVGYLETVSLS